MNRNPRIPVVCIAYGLACLAPGRGALAQDAPAPPPSRWSDSAEFSYVATAGNAESTTLGFKNTLGRKWAGSSIELKAAGVRASSTTTTRTAVGPGPGSFSVIEEKDTALSAENYFLGGRYDHKISPHVFWFTGAGWTRNRFAGVENRYEGSGGLGNVWVDTDRAKFRTDYALSYTKEEDVTSSPDVKDKFAGFRFSWKLEHKIGTTSVYGNYFIVDENLDDTTDLRGNMVNSLAVTVSRRLALKVSLQTLYDHQPAFKKIPLLDAPPPGGVVIGSVLDELKTLDTLFTTSLVVSF